MERRARHRRKYRRLRHHGSLVQGGERHQWHPALSIPRALRLHRPAHHLSGQGWPPVYRHDVGRGRLGRRGGDQGRRYRHQGAQWRTGIHRRDERFARRDRGWLDLDGVRPSSGRPCAAAGYTGGRPMSKLSWIVAAIASVIVIVVVVALARIMQPAMGAGPSYATGYSGLVAAEKLLRVPVTGIYPGGSSRGLLPNMQNPLANDPDAVARGAKDFDNFNCSGCHMARGGGGM